MQILELSITESERVHIRSKVNILRGRSRQSWIGLNLFQRAGGCIFNTISITAVSIILFVLACALPKKDPTHVNEMTKTSLATRQVPIGSTYVDVHFVVCQICWLEATHQTMKMRKYAEPNSTSWWWVNIRLTSRSDIMLFPVEIRGLLIIIMRESARNLVIHSDEYAAYCCLTASR